MKNLKIFKSLERIASSAAGACSIEEIVVAVGVTLAVLAAQTQLGAEISSEFDTTRSAMQGVGTMGGTNPDDGFFKGGNNNNKSGCSEGRLVDGPPGSSC
ncbi:MAG: hypothetical protein KDD70_03470 [Bdellovibrionales bacterium]|nr:hypothetical protein [Bdellovibrionales bacterium]